MILEQSVYTGCVGSFLALSLRFALCVLWCLTHCQRILGLCVDLEEKSGAHVRRFSGADFPPKNKKEQHRPLAFIDFGILIKFNAFSLSACN
jgi:hypothetical protein